MKKALILALSGLFLALSLGQAADARGTLTVINMTKYPGKFSIVYYTHLCRDDHPTIAAKGRWSVNSGLCEVKDSVFQLTDSKGKLQTCQSTRGKTLQAVFRIQIMNDPSELEEMGRKNNITLHSNNKDPFCGVASA